MKSIISTPKAPAAIGPYSQAVKTNNLLFTSGQIAIDPATGNIVGSNITEQAEQVLKNISAILSEAGYSLSDVVKTTVFITDMSKFAELNDIYSKFFNGATPARSAVEVSALPKGALVEIETIASK